MRRLQFIRSLAGHSLPPSPSLQHASNSFLAANPAFYQTMHSILSQDFMGKVVRESTVDRETTLFLKMLLMQ